MELPPHRTELVQSGEVALFCRAFGPAAVAPGQTPLLVMHGSNYFDSYDWIGVAARLSASGRPVVAFDQRGFGLSGWSDVKDYSLDALFGDMRAVTAHFGWNRPAVLGHSVSGRLAILFAASCPGHLSRLIVADTAMGKGNPGRYQLSLDNPAEVFPTVEAAMTHLAGKDNPPRFARDRDRAVLALQEVAGGYALRRDPDHRNTQSQAPGAVRPAFADLDCWNALAAVACPVTFVRGSRSDRNVPAHYARLAAAFPAVAIETIDSQHDMAFEAPDALAAVVGRILATPSASRATAPGPTTSQGDATCH